MRPPVLSPALQQLSSAWQGALARPSPAAAALSAPAFLERVGQAGVLYGGRPLCVVRQPLVVDDAIVSAYARVLACFRVAVRVARELLVEDGLDGRPDSLAVRIGVDAHALDLARIEPGYTSAAVLARADSYLAQDEHGHLRPQFLELNAESPAGMAYGDALSALFLSDPLTHELRLSLQAFDITRAAARAVLATWRSWAGGARQPTVAIVDLAGVPTRPEFLLFRAAFEAQGLRCLVVDAEDLDFDGARLRVDGATIDLVYRRLLVSDVRKHPAACAALVDAYRARAVCVVNSFRTSLLHGKGLFALFHDPVLRRRLPTGVVDVLDACVPWTGLLSPGDVDATDRLRERALLEPSAWALKPLAEHGGQGVVLGWQADQRTWAAAVGQAQAHVLQRRVPTWSAAFPDARRAYALCDRVISLDPFLVRGTLAGFLCRLGEGQLANVSAGAASQIPVLRLV